MTTPGARESQQEISVFAVEVTHTQAASPHHKQSLDSLP